MIATSEIISSGHEHKSRCSVENGQSVQLFVSKKKRKRDLRFVNGWGAMTLLPCH